jgi:hypothetical protein
VIGESKNTMYQMPPHSNDPKTRLAGIVMLIIGIIGCGYLGYLYFFGGRAYDIILFMPPVLVCYGLLGIVSPDSFQSLQGGYNSKIKPLATVTMIFALILGAAIRFFLFSDWKKI